MSALFDDYAAYHRHPKNKLCHYLGIPVIVFTAVGLLAQASLAAAVVVALFFVAYDFRLSPKPTLVLAAFLALSFWAAPSLPASVLWAGFVAGWILQFVGHYVYEKKSPAFFKNLQQLLIGPIWIIESLRGAPSPRPDSPRTASPAD